MAINMKRFLIYMINFYQKYVSFLLGNNCRFYPTCSNYAIEALKKYTLFRAVKLITVRVLRCNPWGGSGVDMLPDENVKNKD